MNPIFRERTLTGTTGPFDLKFKKIAEIFSFDEPPYICAGATGGGKTTMAIDIIFNYGPKASRIYYVSATKAAIDEQAINLIPEVCRRTPTYENLSAIWNEIKSTCEQCKQPPEQIMNLLPKLYDKEDVKVITSTIQQAERELAKKNDAQSVIAWKLEVVTRLIVDAVQQRGHKNLSIDELSVVTNLISAQQKTILILDDVSSELSKLKSSKQKVMVGSNTMSVAEAYKSVLTDILTKARHFQCICVIFIHDWNIIEGKEQATNFIMLDSTAVSSIANKRSINSIIVEKAKICSPLIFTSMYKYHFLVIKKNGEEVCVSKADLHDGEELDLDKLNKHLLEAYKNVTLGLTDEPMSCEQKMSVDKNNEEDEDDDDDSVSSVSSVSSDGESNEEDSDDDEDGSESDDNGNAFDAPI